MSAQKLVIKRVSNNVFDIFFGKGWDNCVRVRKLFDKVSKKVFFSIIPTDTGTVTLPREIWSQIKEVI